MFEVKITAHDPKDQSTAGALEVLVSAILNMPCIGRDAESNPVGIGNIDILAGEDSDF